MQRQLEQIFTFFKFNFFRLVGYILTILSNWLFHGENALQKTLVLLEINISDIEPVENLVHSAPHASESRVTHLILHHHRCQEKRRGVYLFPGRADDSRVSRRARVCKFGRLPYLLRILLYFGTSSRHQLPTSRWISPCSRENANFYDVWLCHLHFVQSVIALLRFLTFALTEHQDSTLVLCGVRGWEINDTQLGKSDWRDGKNGCFFMK